MIKSYPIIASSSSTLLILKMIGKSATPISPATIASISNLTYAKVMTHIATLLNANLIQESDGGYIGSMELATMWAMRKAQVERREKELAEEKKTLGIE